MKYILRVKAVLGVLCLGSSLSFAAATASAATLPAGKVWAGEITFPWGSPRVINGQALPSTVTNLTFPMTIKPDTIRVKGYYLAGQYYFPKKGGDSLGYLGLQPQKDENGKQRMQAIFSSFDPDAITHDSNCRPGADGGKGVSCSVIFDAEYGARYDITIHKTGDHLWSGELVNNHTGKKIHLGSYKLPAETGNLKLTGEFFLEYYAGSPQWTLNKCSDLPKISAAVGPVYSQDAGGIITALGALKEQQPDKNGPVCHGAPSGYVAGQEKFAIKFANNSKIYSEEGRSFSRGFGPAALNFSTKNSSFKIEPVPHKACIDLALYAKDVNNRPIGDARLRFKFSAYHGTELLVHDIFLYATSSNKSRYFHEICNQLKDGPHSFKLYLDGIDTGMSVFYPGLKPGTNG